MATTAQRLIVNVETGTLVPSFEGVVGTTAPRYTLGDTTPVEIYLVKSTGSTGAITQVPFPAGSTVRLGVGTVNELPAGGTWALTFGGDTTAALAYNITPAALQTALNALASVTAAGGVTVSQVGTQYQITFNNDGARADFTGEPLSLFPASQVGIQTLQQGDASTQEIVLVALAVSPVALTTTFTDVAPAGGIFGANTFELTGGVRGGGFKLQLQFTQGATVYTVWTETITANLPTTDISQAIFNALTNAGWGFVTGNETTNSWGLRVTALDTLSWRVDFTKPIFTTPIAVVAPTITGIDTTALTSLAGKQGNISLATVEAIAYLGSSESKQATLEIEVESAGDVQTLLQANCTLGGQVIVSGAFAPLVADVPLGEAVANNRFVRRDAAQTVDPTSQNQIWENLLGSNSIAGVDIAPAILGANSPDGSNAFATLSDLPAPVDQSLNTTDAVNFAGITVGATTIDSLLLTVGDTLRFSDTTEQTTAFVPADWLSKAGNLAGLASTATARTNLGLGTMATATATDYLAKADNLSGLASVATARTNLGLGTMATAAAADYLAKADNLAGLASVSTARTNLGLGTMATATATDYLAKADNLSGIASPSTAATNIGLGTADAVTHLEVTATDGIFLTKIEGGGLLLPDGNRLEAAAYAAAAGLSGGSGSTIHNGDYPDEIQVVIGGVTYGMPARVI